MKVIRIAAIGAIFTLALTLAAIAAQAAGPAAIPPTPEPPTPTATHTPTPTATATPKATATPTATASATPTATATPEWDKSSLAIAAHCSAGNPAFTITNHGASMKAPTTVYFLNVSGGASACADDIAAGALSKDTIQIDAGQSTTVFFSAAGLAPPYRACVAQAAGHPGTGYASATLDAAAGKECTTAEPVTAEPAAAGRVFLPNVSRR